MFFSHIFSRIAFLSLSFLLISTDALFADTLSKEATFYSDSFDGGSTSNGDTFSQVEHSAAICGMDLGQYLYVSKGGTGIVVKANDRPNCTKYPNVIDLSREAFRFLAPLSAGRLSDVSVTPIGWAPKSPKGFLAKDAFAHLGIGLDSNIPTVLFRGEGIEIRGRVTDGQKNIIVYLANDAETISPQSFLVQVKKDGTFRTVLTLPNTSGSYSLVLASGNSFNTSTFSTIELIDRNILAYPILSGSLAKIVPVFVSGRTPYLTLPSGVWASMKVTQDGKSVETAGTAISLKGVPLRPGIADIETRGYTLSTPSPLDIGSEIPRTRSRVILDRTHEDVGTDLMTFQKKRSIANFRFTVPSTPRLRSEYYVTFPDGSVKQYTFPGEFVTDDLLIPGKSLKISFPFSQDGAYRIEIVREDGIAYINTTTTRGKVWSLISTISDEVRDTLRKNIDTVRTSLMKKINTLRMSLGKDMVVLDSELTRLAQMKADDMVARGYAAHRDPDGNYIDGFATKRGFDLQSALGENIAYGTISDLALQDGLEESGSHRYNMLRGEWKKIGIGYALSGGKTYLVQVFSE